VEEVFEWQRKVSRTQLYFDGSSKGNPKEATVGGVIVNLDENKEIKFAWGLGTAMNNHA